VFGPHIFLHFPTVCYQSLYRAFRTLSEGHGDCAGGCILSLGGFRRGQDHATIYGNLPAIYLSYQDSTVLFCVTIDLIQSTCELQAHAAIINDYDEPQDAGQCTLLGGVVAQLDDEGNLRRAGQVKSLVRMEGLTIFSSH
tara:strand:- start:47 stop:466 length:420 start_codon:yes stop_codon:yes gene_type:complete